MMRKARRVYVYVRTTSEEMKTATQVRFSKKEKNNMFNLSLMRVYLHIINLQNRKKKKKKRKEQNIYTGVKTAKTCHSSFKSETLKKVSEFIKY